MRRDITDEKHIARDACMHGVTRALMDCGISCRLR